MSTIVGLVSVVIAAVAPPKPGVDLARIIECRADLAAYHDLGTKLGADLSGAPLGWKRIGQANAFLTEFELPRSLKVFGRSTRRVAVTGSAVLAILDKVTPAALGAELHLKPVVLAPGRSILARVIKQDSDAVASTVIRLNVSTVDTHPGKVLAGCEYSVDVK